MTIGEYKNFTFLDSLLFFFVFAAFFNILIYFLGLSDFIGYFISEISFTLTFLCCSLRIKFCQMFFKNIFASVEVSCND